MSNFRGPSPEFYDVRLFMMIYEIVNETNRNDILTPLFDSCFPEWIQLYNKMLIDYNPTLKKSNLPNNQHFDAIIMLLSESVEENDENVKLVADNTLNDEIYGIVEHSDWKFNRYVPCLKLIGELSNINSACADEFISLGTEKNILKLIKKSLT